MKGKRRFIDRALTEPQFRAAIFAYASLTLNACYAVYNGVLGIIYGSLWYFTLLFYYALLSSARFRVARIAISHDSYRKDAGIESTRHFTGVMLIAMSIVLLISVSLSALGRAGDKNARAVTLSIAVYTLYKLGLALYNGRKARKRGSELLMTLRGISEADAVVSLFTLLRSVTSSALASDKASAKLADLLLGIAVSAAVMLLGTRLASTDIKDRR